MGVTNASMPGSCRSSVRPRHPIHGRSSDSRSKPSSARGTAIGRRPTDRRKGSRTTSARLSRSRQWCLGTAGQTRRLASPSPAIRQPAKPSCMATCCSTRRARMSWPVPTRPNQSASSMNACPRSGQSCEATPIAWSAISPTSATSSSRSRTGGSGCSRSASASGARRRRCEWPSRWPRTWTSPSRARRRFGALRRCSPTRPRHRPCGAASCCHWRPDCRPRPEWPAGRS